MSFASEERRGALGKRLAYEIHLESPEKSFLDKSKKKWQCSAEGSFMAPKAKDSPDSGTQTKILPAIHPGDSSVVIQT